jgi:hypothetical protein
MQAICHLQTSLILKQCAIYIGQEGENTGTATEINFNGLVSWTKETGRYVKSYLCIYFIVY